VVSRLGVKDPWQQKLFSRYPENMNEVKEYRPTAPLDWSQCPIVESIPGKVSGAWVLKDTRMPVQIIFDNLAAGMDLEEVMDQFSVTRDQINALMKFITHTLDKAPSFEPTEP
jgi:uncharacterized protein (DUF433 family)